MKHKHIFAVSTRDLNRTLFDVPCELEVKTIATTRTSCFINNFSFNHLMLTWFSISAISERILFKPNIVYIDSHSNTKAVIGATTFL